MACVEENWQTKCSSISQRTTFIFNNELLSDVTFVVPVCNGESETKVIPAHKFLLAISSPVFYAMFYGQMAETKDSIELSDCDYESVLELFRFFYSDEVKLTGSNVMHVLYLAKKYMVSSLAEKCAEHLRDNLEASNVFSILPYAQKFEDKDLEDRCWRVIELHTEKAVTSDEFVTLERCLVESVVKREGLYIREVELFKAVDRWAISESKRQGVTPDGESKRRIIGEEIVNAIRFPLMSQEEFVSEVFDSEVLGFREISEIMKHYSGISSTPPFHFIQTPRAGLIKQCYRFTKWHLPDGWWSYTKNQSDGIAFIVNKAVRLHGVRYFGCERGQYTVTIEVKDGVNGSSLVKKSGSYSSEKDQDLGYYGFGVLFEPSVCLSEGRLYEIVSLIKGPKSWYGEEGKQIVECEKVKFTFSNSGASLNATDISRGQFPALLFG